MATKYCPCVFQIYTSHLHSFRGFPFVLELSFSVTYPVSVFGHWSYGLLYSGNAALLHRST